MRILTSRSAALVLACVVLPASAAAARLLILGEQHDQPDQQRQVAAEVQALAVNGQLAAVVLEMAEQPWRTTDLPRDASEAQVREALQWQGWKWEAYSAVVMNAVRAGVPVLGGNLPRAAMRSAMADVTLEPLLDNSMRALLAEAVRSGHCNLLPATQEPGMVRIQIARDQSMAHVVAAALRAAPPDSTVLLLTGAQHASRDRGVPVHLQREMAADLPPLQVVLFSPSTDGLHADERRTAVFTPQEDHCAALRQRLVAPPPASAPSR